MEFNSGFKGLNFWEAAKM